MTHSKDLGDNRFPQLVRISHARCTLCQELMSLTVCVHSQARQFIQLDFPHSSPNVQVTCDVSERMELFPCELKLVFRPRTTVGV